MKLMPFMTALTDHRGNIKQIDYRPPGLMPWIAKVVYRVEECDDPTCPDDCEGCLECTPEYYPMGIRIMTECGERSFFVARDTQKISSQFCGCPDTAGVSITRLKEMHPSHYWIVERLAPYFGYSLQPRAKRRPTNPRIDSKARRAFEQTQYVAPLTQQVHRAKVNKLRKQRCISEAHAVAQYKILANKGINAAIACDGGTYVVKWEDKS